MRKTPDSLRSQLDRKCKCGQVLANHSPLPPHQCFDADCDCEAFEAPDRKITAHAKPEPEIPWRTYLYAALNHAGWEQVLGGLVLAAGAEVARDEVGPEAREAFEEVRTGLAVLAKRIFPYS